MSENLSKGFDSIHSISDTIPYTTVYLVVKNNQTHKWKNTSSEKSSPVYVILIDATGGDLEILG